MLQRSATSIPKALHNFESILQYSHIVKNKGRPFTGQPLFILSAEICSLSCGKNIDDNGTVVEAFLRKFICKRC